MIKNICLNKSKFSSGFTAFKYGKKNKLSEYLVLISERSLLCLKRKFLYEFPKKFSKTTQRLILTVCGSLLWEKQFLLIFVPFYWFDQKQLFKQIQIFLRICPFKHGKKNQVCDYFSARLWDSLALCLKRKLLYEFSQKFFKTTEGYSLAVCGSLCGEKQFLLIFNPFTGLTKNISLN